MAVPLNGNTAQVMADGIQMVFEPRPEGPGPTYAGPIDVEYNWRDIPVNPAFDTEKFLQGDDDPCHITASIPAAWSYNGYFLTEQMVRSIVQQVNTIPCPAGKGHTPISSNDNFSFPDIAGAWVGAIYDEAAKTAYIHGIIDPAFPELKRHIRAGLINRVSTDIVVLETQLTSDGGTAITDGILRSLDFAPRLKNAFDRQAVVAQDTLQQSHSNTAEVIKPMDNIEEPKIVAPVEPMPTEPNPAPEAPPIAEPAPVEPVAPAPQPIAPAGPTELETLIASLGADPVARLKSLFDTEVKFKKAEAEALRGAVLQDMVKDPDARALIGRLVTLEPEADRARYEVVIKDMLGDPAISRVLSGRRGDQVIKPTAVQGGPGGLACPTRSRN